jgi:MFS family permease
VLPALPTRIGPLNKGQLGFIVAWGFCLLFYFGQYALRSAPGVMVPELTSSFGLTTAGVSSLLGLCYYTYSTFAIVAGASLDRLGAKYVIPAGIVVTAIGSILFGLGSYQTAELAACCRAPARRSRSPGRSTSPATASAPPISPPPSASPRCLACWAARRATSRWGR